MGLTYYGTALGMLTAIDRQYPTDQDKQRLAQAPNDVATRKVPGRGRRWSRVGTG